MGIILREIFIEKDREKSPLLRKKEDFEVDFLEILDLKFCKTVITRRQEGKTEITFVAKRVQQ